MIDQDTTEAILNDKMDKMEAEHEPIIEKVIDDAMGAHSVEILGFFCHDSYVKKILMISRLFILSK